MAFASFMLPEAWTLSLGENEAIILVITSIL
jgi:hypothetical protein